MAVSPPNRGTMSSPHGCRGLELSGHTFAQCISSAAPMSSRTGATTASSGPSAMYHLRSTRSPTALVWRLYPSPPDSPHRVSDEPGAIQTGRFDARFPASWVPAFIPIPSHGLVRGLAPRSARS
jgi:hypothetical protein